MTPIPALADPDGFDLGDGGLHVTGAAGGDTVDHKSDLWSLGVVLFEMLTGELPFDGALA